MCDNGESLLGRATSVREKTSRTYRDTMIGRGGHHSSNAHKLTSRDHFLKSMAAEIESIVCCLCRQLVV